MNQNHHNQHSSPRWGLASLFATEAVYSFVKIDRIGCGRNEDNPMLSIVKILPLFRILRGK